MSHRLIINGDDFGLTDGVSAAILAGLNEGWLSSASVMIGVPGADSRIRRAAQMLKPYAGVHLQLAGKPASRLVTDGAPPKYEFEGVDPDRVAAGWEAQIVYARDLGLAPNHIDTHHAVHLDPRILDVYLSLAQKYGLPVRGDSGWVSTRMDEFGVRGSTCIIRNWTGCGGDVNTLLRELDSAMARCKDTDVIEVVSHPAYVDDDLRRVSSLNDARAGDVRGLRQLVASRALEKRGIELRSFSNAFES